jgi:hypothetical protein
MLLMLDLFLFRWPSVVGDLRVQKRFFFHCMISRLSVFVIFYYHFRINQF